MIKPLDVRQVHVIRYLRGTLADIVICDLYQLLSLWIC